jgi:peroxiredoxin
VGSDAASPEGTGPEGTDDTRADVSADGHPAERGRRGIGPFSWRQILGVLLVVAVTAVLVTIGTAPIATLDGAGPGAKPGAGLGADLRDPAATPYLVGEPTEGLRPGDLAPELVTTLDDGGRFVLRDLDGEAVSLASLRGKAVWIDFWASWCPPCQAETPVIRDAYARYRDRGLEIIAISVQESSEDDVRAYAARYGLRHTVAADLRGEIFRLYRVYALPTQFFVRPDGVIDRVVQGPMTEASAAAAIEAILP